jgi:hypothetical protein
MEQWRVRGVRAEQLLLKLAKGWRAREQVVADQGNPAATILTPVRTEPVVLLSPINIALLHAPHDRRGEHRAKSRHEGVAQDVGRDRIEHVSRRDDALSLNEPTDCHHEGLNIRLRPW